MDTQNTLGLNEEYFELQEINIYNGKSFYTRHLLIRLEYIYIENKNILVYMLI